LEWNEFLKTAHELTNRLSVANSREFNDHLDLKLDLYYFIYDCINPQIITCSDGISNVLGYNPIDFSLEKFFDLIHPDDKDIFIKHEHLALDFCLSLEIEKQKDYKIIHDFRMRKSDGYYLRIMQQTAAYEISESAVLKTIIQHMDITNIKASPVPELHFIGRNGHPSYYNIETKADIVKRSTLKFTKRELEILNLLDQANTSEEIANKLFISIHTVRTHRKNLLHKTGCENTIDLLKIVKTLKLL
jgi:DNA-binding CsgD family transcriptional regulator